MAGGKKSSLGKALIRKHLQKHISKKIDPSEAHKHTTDFLPEKAAKVTHSIIDQNSLEEFVQLAQLSNKVFTAEKEVTIVNRNHVLQGSAESASAQRELLSNFLITETVKNPKYQLLKIPRRPAWKEGMTGTEINTQENIAFLQWRRDIAQIEENNVTLAITPFEKNLEVWKQLWRVIERAHVLLQIVDARNPYFFYSADLEKYIKEVDEGKGKKQFLLLVNKADYLTEELRQHWSNYFREHNINHLFFSAL